MLPPKQRSFDFIIVGSGAAGSVLAARLSENQEVAVCVIEAGGQNRSLLCHLPGLGFAV